MADLLLWKNVFIHFWDKNCPFLNVEIGKRQKNDFVFVFLHQPSIVLEIKSLQQLCSFIFRQMAFSILPTRSGVKIFFLNFPLQDAVVQFCVTHLASIEHFLFYQCFFRISVSQRLPNELASLNLQVFCNFSPKAHFLTLSVEGREVDKNISVLFFCTTVPLECSNGFKFVAVF